jgi:fructose-bisphosphate aldolase class I
LAERCKKYYEKGCRFAKWRAVLKIGDGRPSKLAIRENAHTLARYASICQENGLVPIVEPEILTDGSHTIEECACASERVFAGCMKALIEHKVIIEGCLLKPNMITPGSDNQEKVTAQQIAWFTVRTLSRSIVPALPGVVFLSGGQSEEDASLNLNEMNKIT